MENKKGCVYFFKHKGLDPIKIGYSTNESPIDRFESFKTYAPYGALLIGFIKSIDAKKLETLLHRKYKNQRLDGEWFNLTIEQVVSEINNHLIDDQINEMCKFQEYYAKNISLGLNIENNKNKKYFDIVDSMSLNTKFYTSDIEKEYNFNIKNLFNRTKDYLNENKYFLLRGRDVNGRFVIKQKF